MLLDAHHHFWKYNEDEYGWINDEMKVIRRSFLPEELEAEMEKCDVGGVVTVQARQSLAETEWLLELADEHDFIKGVVGWVDLCSEAVESQLKKYSANKKLVGVRHVVQAEPDDRFMLRKEFQHGISLLKKYKLTYDILIYPKHLPIATELMAAFPDQKFVVDHLAKPFIKDKKIEPWKSEMEKLGKHPNVYCKVSGMVTEADWNHWTEKTFCPYLDVVLNAFGTDRIMLGTDWPVCLVAGSYQNVFNIALNYFRQLPANDFEKIAWKNCKAFYGLSL